MTDQDICNQSTNSNVGETSPAVDLPNGGVKSVVIDDSQLVGVPVIIAGDAVAADQAVVLPVEVKTDVKRKRGRPPRGQAKQPPVKKQKDDEDVCFICFDGGSLVICDRRGCPKAYHPACIKRDEAFFKSKSKWNCGWHICSVCQKSAHYMCYTCPFSLCKGCTRDSSYLCVRGDKGFCNTCMKVIMLIENKEQINKEVAQVDFDDARNWEYLFKIYWISLKEELSLTSKELAEAKNPWKESGSVTTKKQPYKALGSKNNINSAVFDISSGHLKVGDSLRQNCSESTQGCTKWATEKLLDFVAYMKNGDTSVLSQFDVQVLVLDYIKQKNLHDPCDRSYVVCDTKLESLFGKSRVEHSEMPKLLNFHFLLKEEPTNDASAGGRVQVDTVKVSSDQSNNNLTSKDEKHKPCKSAQYAVQTSLNDYAAVNVPNMNLIYLRRNLVENLTQVKDKFHEMVVGSFVRIRVSGDEHKQDMYRLVQVVGTTKVSVPYKISNATTDMMLEILNLDKKEVLSIDAISNQEFSEDECRHLRQSIKCGIVKRFTVGEIQKKAMQLRGVRLHDNLGAEISRLNHLREEANRSALEKEVRECVEKIQLLKAPAEIHRRLSQIPEVISDPDMDPNLQSEEDAGEHGHHVEPCNPEYNTEGNEQVSLRKRGDASGDNSSSQCNSSSPQCEQSKNVCATSYPDKEENAAKALQRLSEEKYACRSNSLERVGWNSQAVTSSTTISTVLSEASSAPSVIGNPLSAYSGETKLWHYRGPNGSIQGPFTVVELLKWSTTGCFPLDMKIWANGKQDDPVLLTDVLNGLFHKALPGQNDSISQLREVGVTSDSKLCNSNFVYSENSNAREDGRQIEGKWHGSIAQVNSRSKNEIVGSGRLVTQPSAWTAPIVSYNKDITSGIASQSQDSFKGTNFCYQPLQAHSSLSSTTHTVKDYASHPHELNPKVESRSLNSDREISLSRGISICDNTGHIQMNHCHSQGYAGQTSGRNLGHPPVNFSPHNLDLNSAFCPTKSTDSPDQNGDAIMNVNSPPLKTSSKDWESETIENKEPVSSGGHFHNPSFRYQPNSPVKMNNNYQKGLVAEKKQSVSLNISVQDSGPSWSSTSSIMVGRSQLPHINDGWGGYNSAPAKHSGVWDPNHISVSTSSLHDHTATSRSSDFSHFSLSNPVSNLTSWHMSGSEPIEFSTLAEESVSDLLAEVDAMESQCGMGSPTSMMNSGEDLINLNLEMA